MVQDPDCLLLLRPGEPASGPWLGRGAWGPGTGRPDPAARGAHSLGAHFPPPPLAPPPVLLGVCLQPVGPLCNRVSATLEAPALRSPARARSLQLRRWAWLIFTRFLPSEEGRLETVGAGVHRLQGKLREREREGAFGRPAFITAQPPNHGRILQRTSGEKRAGKNPCPCPSPSPSAPSLPLRGGPRAAAGDASALLAPAQPAWAGRAAALEGPPSLPGARDPGEPHESRKGSGGDRTQQQPLPGAPFLRGGPHRPPRRAAARVLGSPAWSAV